MKSAGLWMSDSRDLPDISLSLQLYKGFMLALGGGMIGDEGWGSSLQGSPQAPAPSPPFQARPHEELER